MLESIRNHAKGWIAKVILALISIPFVLFGLDSYLHGNASDNALVEVDGMPISQQEYDLDIKNQTQRMRESMGANFDPSMAQDPVFRQKVLDALVEKRVTALSAEKLKLYAPDSAVAVVLAGVEAFQDKGVFSRQRYEAVLRQNGRTPAQFENEIRLSIMQEILGSPISKAAFVSRTSAEQLALLVAQQREVSWHDIPPAAAQGIDVQPAAVKAYYDAHAADFAVPEAIEVEYVRFSLADYAAALPIDDAAARAYYAANSNQYGEGEQRSASHILITVDKSATPAVRAQAKARAEEIMQTLKRTPGKFAELARTQSQDPASAEQGGSLGSFGRGMMVKPFEEAVFSMKPGELRGPVESEFGYHVIRLDGIKPSGVPPFEAVRGRVLEQMRLAQAQKSFPEQAENFSNLVYENADSLAPAAQAMKTTVQKSGWMSEKTAPAPFDNPKLTKVLFAPDTIKSKQNTEAIEIEPGVLVAARVVGHKPASRKPLEEVRQAIIDKLRTEQIASLTAKRGKEMIDALKQGREAGIAWTDFQTVNRQMGGVLGAAGIRAVFQTSTAKLPGYSGYALPDGGYRVLRVSRVIAPPLPEAGVMKSVVNGLNQATQNADTQAWLALIKQDHKIRTLKKPSDQE